MGGHQEAPQLPVIPLDKKKTRVFWKIALYLALITAVEFVIAFTVPSEYKWGRIIIFILLTLVKAYYIVSEFMHLGHEVRPLILSIVLPIVFLLWLILSMHMEAQSIFDWIKDYWQIQIYQY